MRIPFIRQYKYPLKEISDKLDCITQTGFYTRGLNVREFEERTREYLDVDYVVSCGSGTNALLIALKTLKELKGFKTVTIPSFTWVSTKLAPDWLGYEIRYGDIDPETWNLSQDNLPESDLTIGVDCFGNKCLLDVDEEHLMIDAAQSFGTKGVGSRGLLEIFSFSGSKLVTTSGEGGLIATNHRDIYNKIMKFRDLVSRMDEISAVVGNHFLCHIDEILSKKKEIYQFYRNNLPFKFQKIIESNHSLIGCLASNREELIEKHPEIEFKTYYHPLKTGLENTDSVSRQCLCLPCGIYTDYRRVVELIKK